MIGHLGSRVSALLDGQLSAEETERAWGHVHACHQCRDLVEREGWVKTRLAGLSWAGSGAPDHLKGSLLGGSPAPACPPAPHPALVSRLTAAPQMFLDESPHHHTVGARRAAGLAAIGGSAVGAAVMGVLVLGVGPAQAPTMDQRVPVSHLISPAARLAGPTAPAPRSTTATPVSDQSRRDAR